MKVLLNHFSKIKSQKKSQNSKNQGFSYYFCLMIRIQEAQKHVDPVDPDPDSDPQQCFFQLLIVQKALESGQ